MSKKSIKRTVAVLLIGAIAYMALTECRPGRPTSFNFWRVEEGMAQGDVEAILGPGMSLHEGKAGHERIIVPGQPAADVDHVLRWAATDFGSKYLLIGFKDGRVRYKYEASLGS